MSTEQRESLAKRANITASAAITPFFLMGKGVPLPEKVVVGMSDVPVLDQGEHGTCATFAATAALDAMNKSGNYISQLCFLELTTSLHQIDPVDYPEDGWDRYPPNKVLKLIQTYGIVSNNFMKQHGCANSYSYSSHTEFAGTPSFTEYQQMSEPSFKFTTQSIDIFNSPLDPDTILQNIKLALSKYHLVLLSYLIDTSKRSSGAYGSTTPFNGLYHLIYNSGYEGWIMTPDIRRNLRNKFTELGAHIIIITAYDDNAILYDINGHQHKGRFTLRNSWGTDAGIDGNYYMSYEYLTLMGEEAIEIIPDTGG